MLEYYFECAKCEEESESLGKDHTRLLPKQAWVCSGCSEEFLSETANTKVRDLSNGVLVEETDF